MTKQMTTEIQDKSAADAIPHKTISTRSLAAYARAKYALRRNVRYAARKLVATEMVLGTRLAV